MRTLRSVMATCDLYKIPFRCGTKERPCCLYGWKNIGPKSVEILQKAGYDVCYYPLTVEIPELKRVLEWIDKINRTPLENIEWTRGRGPMQKDIKYWHFTGKDNISFARDVLFNL